MSYSNLYETEADYLKHKIYWLEIDKKKLECCGNCCNATFDENHVLSCKMGYYTQINEAPCQINRQAGYWNKPAEKEVYTANMKAKRK